MLIKRIFSIYRKYGGFEAPFNVIKWKIFKLKNIYIGKKILKIDKGFFVPLGKSKFSVLYEGNKIDFDRVVKGDRKILFYNEDDENKKFDIKTKWELNRCHEGSILALFPGNNDEHLERLFDTKQLQGILKDTNAMEVSIAAINIITSYTLLSEKIKAKYRSIIALHLKESLIFILNNLEKGIEYSANHYFFDLLGILWICESIQGNTHIEKLKILAGKELKILLHQFIASDGSLYEGSTYYHKYVTESFLLFLYELESFHSDNELRLFAEKMVGFVKSISINQQVIGIGDNDSGRILPLPSYFEYESSDIKLINKLTILLNLKESAGSLEDCGKNEDNDFGLYILESHSWQAAVRLETGIRRYRKVIGGHCHNDQLHISVFYKNEPVFVDSGVYSYISKNNYRVEALSTSSHNTLEINHQEQNNIFNNFNYTKRTAIGRILFYDPSEFVGEHNAFKKFGIIHQREISFESECLIIKDNILSNKPDRVYTAKIYYHVHPDFDVKIVSETILLKRDWVCFNMNMTGIDSFIVEDSFFSSEYGKRIKNSVIVLKCKIGIGQINTNIKTVIQRN